ncbi:RxLR effector protein [Phytophthora megakarya]|uniref:RxLR effector protein n=1 Tax=Phytophthora megakarya TaxID=4795 RepID=A0A225WZ20_9STRA|nr:RxLR effector protein [Phytophthora megakarya]
MRELTVVTLIAFASVALGSISSSCSENAIEPGVKHLARTLSLNPKQVTRSLRQYDFRDVVEPEGERGIGGISEKADDILRKAEGLIGKGQLSSTLNGAVSKALMVADDAATISRSMEKYPKGLSTATMKQIRIVEEMRLNDIATWTKETGSGMRRKIEPFEGIKIAPKKYLEAHVGKDLKRYGEDGSRLVSAAVVSRSAKEGGGDVLLISNSKPSNRDFLLPKGGWEKHEGIEHAALREVIEEGGVCRRRCSICFSLLTTI